MSAEDAAAVSEMMPDMSVAKEIAQPEEPPVEEPPVEEPQPEKEQPEKDPENEQPQQAQQPQKEQPQKEQPQKEQPQKEQPQKEQEEETEWPCPVCTLLNPLTRRSCEMCGSWRPMKYSKQGQSVPNVVNMPAEEAEVGVADAPAQEEAAPPKEPAVEESQPEKETEWPCEICTFLNPLARRICEVCGSRRPMKYSKQGQSFSKDLLATGEEKIWRDELKVDDEVDILVPLNMGGMVMSIYIKGVVSEILDEIIHVKVELGIQRMTLQVSKYSLKSVCKPGTESPKFESVIRMFFGGAGIPEPAREDPVTAEEKKWRLGLKKGDELDALDTQGEWFIAEIIDVKMEDDKKKFYITYSEWIGDQYNEWLAQDSNRIRMPYTKSKPRGMRADPLNDYQGRMPDYSKVVTTLTAKSINSNPVPRSVAEGRFLKINMPKDNSCMFYSLSYVCESKPPHATKWVLSQRLKVANHISEHKEDYPEWTLGSEPEVYIDGLKRLRSWGGAIELSILSQLYQTQIVAIDTIQCVVYKFPDSSDHGYKTRVFTAYSGNHYDALAFLPEGSSELQEKFDINDHKAFDAAIKHAELLHMATRKCFVKTASMDWKGLGEMHSAVEGPGQLLRQRSDFSVSVSTDLPALRRARSEPLVSPSTKHTTASVVSPASDTQKETEEKKTEEKNE